MRALEMKNPSLILESLNRQNISYDAKVINHDHAQTSVADLFKFVNIWHTNVANDILFAFSKVFKRY